MAESWLSFASHQVTRCHQVDGACRVVAASGTDCDVAACLHTAGVVGSSPISPTAQNPRSHGLGFFRFPLDSSGSLWLNRDMSATATSNNRIDMTAATTNPGRYWQNGRCYVPGGWVVRVAGTFTYNGYTSDGELVAEQVGFEDAERAVVA